MKKKTLRTLLTFALVLAMAFPVASFAEVAQYRDGSNDEYWTSGSLDGASDEVIARAASTGGFSSGVLMDILNSGRCHAYIDTWKAMGEIPQDFYPTGTSNTTSNTAVTTPKTEDTTTNTTTNTATPSKPSYTQEDIDNAWHVTENTDATCTEDGLIVYKNKITGETKEEVLKATDHEYELATQFDATCTEAGTTTYVCKNCTDTYTEETEKVAHTVGDWETEKPAEPFAEGERTQSCTVCGELLATETIPQTFPLSKTATIGGSVALLAVIAGTIIVIKKKNTTTKEEVA